MNKKLVSLIVGASLLAGCSAQQEINLSKYTKPEKSIEENIELPMGMCFQTAYLTYHDIFSYTKPQIENNHAKELNPVWAQLNNQRLFGLSYSLQLGALILGDGLSYLMDNSGNLTKILNGILSLGEVYAIGYNNQFVKTNLNFNADIFTLLF